LAGFFAANRRDGARLPRTSLLSAAGGVVRFPQPPGRVVAGAAAPRNLGWGRCDCGLER